MCRKGGGQNNPCKGVALRLLDKFIDTYKIKEQQQQLYVLYFTIRFTVHILNAFINLFRTKDPVHQFVCSSSIVFVVTSSSIVQFPLLPSLYSSASKG